MPTLYYPSIIASISFFFFVLYVYVEDRKKERKRIDQRRKSEKSKPNEQTFIDVRVWMCVRERDIAHRPLRMCRYIWLSTRREREREREKHHRTYPFMNIDQLVIAHRQKRTRWIVMKTNERVIHFRFFSILLNEHSTYYIHKYVLLLIYQQS